MLQWGLYAAALRLPFLPTRAGLGSDVVRINPTSRTVRSPYDDGEELLAMPALALDAALVHVNHADARGNAQILGPDPYFDDLFCGAAKRRFVSCERIVATDDLAKSRLLPHAAHRAPHGRRRDRGALRRALHRVRARLRHATRPSSAATPTPPRRRRRPGATTARASSTSPSAEYQARGGARATMRAGESDEPIRASYTLAELCVVAGRRGLPRRRRDPGQRLRHRARDRRAPREAHLRAGPADDRRRVACSSPTRRRCGPARGRSPSSRAGCRSARSSTCSGPAAATR